MVKPVVLVVAVIPVIFAILIAIPMLTQTEVPSSAANPYDEIELEYIKHQLKKVSFGLTENIESQKTEILIIHNDGSVRYSLIEDGVPKPDRNFQIDESKVQKLAALIKETGFMFIPSESFPVREDIEEYQKSSLKITFNDKINKIHWPEQNATEKFVPPIITIVELELDTIIDQLIE